MALKEYVPDDLIDLVALQQARLQEHAIMMTIRSAKAQGGKQMDIRNMFGKKAKKETESGEKDVLKRYKVEYTAVFAAVSNAGKN